MLLRFEGCRYCGGFIKGFIYWQLVRSSNLYIPVVSDYWVISPSGSRDLLAATCGCARDAAGICCDRVEGLPSIDFCAL